MKLRWAAVEMVEQDYRSYEWQAWWAPVMRLLLTHDLTEHGRMNVRAQICSCGITPVRDLDIFLRAPLRRGLRTYISSKRPLG